jgi:hypothetical protein
MTLATVNIQVLVQAELDSYLAQQSQESAQHEIDSVDDVFGPLYRVWRGEQGINLLGTFYQNLDSYWISQPCNSDERLSWLSSDEAVAAILNA